MQIVAGAAANALIARTAIGQRAIGDRPQIDHGIAVAVPGVRCIKAEHPAIAKEAQIGIILGADIGADHRLHLEIGADRVGRGVGQRREVGAEVVVDHRILLQTKAIDVVQRGRTGCIDLRLQHRIAGRIVTVDEIAGGHTAHELAFQIDGVEAGAVVGQAVGEQHQRHAATEHADAARNPGTLIRLPVQRNARLEHRYAIDRRGVAEAIAVGEVLVEGDLALVERESIETCAEQRRQLRRDLPFILQAEGIGINGEARRAARCRVAINGVGEGHAVGIAGVIIGNRVEVKVAARVRHEDVVDLLADAFHLELDAVRTGVIAHVELEIQIVGGQRVRLAERIRTEGHAGVGAAVDVVVGRVGANGNAGRIGANLKLAKALILIADLPAHIVAIADTQFGGQLVAPGRVQLAGIDLGRFGAFIAVALQADVGRGIRVARSTARQRHRVEVIDIGQRQPLAFGDVPVDLSRNLAVAFLFLLERVQRIVPITALGGRDDAVDEGAVVGIRRRITDVRDGIGKAFAGNARCDQLAAFGQLFIIEGNEQRVLDDRARSEEAIVLERQGLRDDRTAHIAAGQALAADAAISNRVIFIGPGLKHGIDGTTGEIALAHVERR